MDFSRHQQQAVRTGRRLRFGYAAAVSGVVLVFNVAALVFWWAAFPGTPPPSGFVATNLLATGGLILGGTLVERSRLGHDAALIAERMGARRLDPGAAGLSLLERRAVNVLEEMALAARIPIPRLYLLARDDTINALATGLTREDATVMLTQGAIDRLTRDELQGVIAHEVAHLASGDVTVHTRLAAMNYGLELVAHAGRKALGEYGLSADSGQSVPNHSALQLVLFVPGLLLLLVGSVGHLAALLLTAAMGRTNEFHADALAVRLTRDPNGLGDALRKLVWMDREDNVPIRLPAALHGLEHAMFHRPGGLRGWLRPAWFDTHPPLAERIARLLGRAELGARPSLEAARGAADDMSLSRDLDRSASWLARNALPPLAYTVEMPPGEARTGDAPAGDASAGNASAGNASAGNASAGNASAGNASAGDTPPGDGCGSDSQRPPRLIASDRQTLAPLVAATRNANGAAALCALLILGAGREAEVWPDRWRAAQLRQDAIAAGLRLLGPAAIEGLRWPLIEMCAATLKPLAEPWREELLRMLRGQIELDRRVTLAEWIYYMLLRARLLPQVEGAWRGDERAANSAEAVRWTVSLLAAVAGEPALRGERLAHDIVRELGLNRTGQSHPPHDVGGLQAAVAVLRRLPMLQRPLFIRRLVAWLPAEAPIEARDFVRVLALIIDTPMPHFAPIRLESPDATTMPTELTRTPSPPPGQRGRCSDSQASRVSSAMRRPSAISSGAR